MKYNATTLFAAAAAAALVSIASASVTPECSEMASGELGEPAACPMLPATLPDLPVDDPVDVNIPCIEVIFKGDQCKIDPFTPASAVSAVSESHLKALADCNCAGNSFTDWLKCQSCLLEHGLYREVSDIWFDILSTAKSALCGVAQLPYVVPDFPSPAQTKISISTTPVPSIIPIISSNTDGSSQIVLETGDIWNPLATATPASWAADQTAAVTAFGPQDSCDVAANSGSQDSNEEDIIVTGPTITGITLTASVTNQNFSAAVIPTDPPRKPVVQSAPGWEVSTETSNAVSSFEKLGVTLAIAGGLILGVL